MTGRAMVTSPTGAGGGNRDKIYYADLALSSTGDTVARTSALGVSKAWVGVSILLKAAPPVVNGNIDLSWTATPDTYATGYEIIRTVPGGGPTTPISGRTTLAWQDTTAVSTTAYTYTITSVYGAIRSATRTVAVPIC
jgi:hypothetical protein